MSLKIRLRQQGRTNAKAYRLVVIDGRSPRDGKYVEVVGHYSPQMEGETAENVNEDRVMFWLDNGAVPSEKAKALIARAAPGAMKKFREKALAKKAKKAKARRSKK